MNIAKKLTVFSVLFSMLFLVSCDSDSDDPATSGTLNVTINFTNAEAWPADGTVFCSMDSVWPPQGAPYKSTTLQSSQVQNGVISLVFEDIEFNTYKLLSVSWRDPNDPNPATNQYIWGAHSGSMFENGQEHLVPHHNSFMRNLYKYVHIWKSFSSNALRSHRCLTNER